MEFIPKLPISGEYEDILIVKVRLATNANFILTSTSIAERRAVAAKFGIPVCPHAGGVGLCEYVQHLAAFDYLCVSASLENRVVEFVDHLHEHFVDPVRIRRGRYLLPEKPGYSIEIFPETLRDYSYPDGPIWRG